MTVDLTTEDLETISHWYRSASGESATDRDAPMFELLDKLGIHATTSDLYFPDPMHTIEECRQEVYESIEAMKAYRLRHPDYEEVQDAIREDQL